MMEDMTIYDWGPFVLAYLYHDMHQVIYSKDRNIGEGVTLLHMWAYEHIVILRPQISDV